MKIVKRLFFLVFEIGLITTMYVWFNARKIINRFLVFVKLKDFYPRFEELIKDESVPKYCSHLIYLTKANNPNQIEKRIINSIFSNSPKRADLYWFIHIDTTNEPFTMEYEVEELVEDRVIRVDFSLGFRVQPRVGLMLRTVVEEMLNNREFNIVSRYPSLNKEDIQNFKFVILERFLSYDNVFSAGDGFILNSYFGINKFALSDRESYGLDSNQTVIEKTPLVVTPISDIKLIRRTHRERNTGS